MITYFRSSSYGCHDMCPMKYFLEYELGWRGPSNLKAEKGTIVHKILELLGQIKLEQQNGKTHFVDEIVGKVDIFDYDLDKIIEQCHDHYKKYSVNEWKALDLKHCSKWTYKALEYQGGEYDPRNSHIINVEQAFDFEIDQDWAKYSYDLPDGSTLDGTLSVKGTIDQITRLDDETYQILDWKTGRRLNWATGEEKDYEALNKDHQLMMYYYACRKLFPDIPNIQLVIYYINDGGPFTLCFSDADLPRIEDMLRKKFEEIRDTEVPAVRKTWKCTKFCHFGRSTFDGTSIKPIVEMRNGQVVKKGEKMTKCEQARYCLAHRSVDSVVANMSVPGHHVDFYKRPGEVDDSNG